MIKTINFRLNADDHALFHRMAGIHNRSLSSYIRHLVRADAVAQKVIADPAKTAAAELNPMGLTDNKPVDKSVNPLNPAWKKGQTREVPRMANGDPDTEEFLPMMRGMARRGASRSDIAREFGVSTDFLEYTCLYHAKHCRTHPVMPWHTEREEARLISAQTDAKYAALTFNHSPDTPALPPSMTPATHTHTTPTPLPCHGSTTQAQSPMTFSTTRPTPAPTPAPPTPTMPTPATPTFRLDTVPNPTYNM